MPDPTQPRHVAHVTLDTTAVTRSPLFAAIPTRHTNRGRYDTDRPLATGTLTALTDLIDVDTTRLIWFTTTEDRRAFGELTTQATDAIIADPQQAVDDFNWYRTDWQQIQSTKDGVTIDASGQPPLIRAAAKLLGTSRQQNDDGWRKATRDVQVATAAAFGVLLVRDRLDAAQRIVTGRLWQRIHLWASTRALGMQPLNQVLERIDRERSAGLSPQFTGSMAGMLPTGWHPLMAFRIGYPTADALPSPRRPAEQVRLP